MPVTIPIQNSAITSRRWNDGEKTASINIDGAEFKFMLSDFEAFTQLCEMIETARRAGMVDAVQSLNGHLDRLCNEIDIMR